MGRLSRTSTSRLRSTAGGCPHHTLELAEQVVGGPGYLRQGFGVDLERGRSSMPANCSAAIACSRLRSSSSLAVATVNPAAAWWPPMAINSPYTGQGCGDVNSGWSGTSPGLSSSPSSDDDMAGRTLSVRRLAASRTHARRNQGRRQGTGRRRGGRAQDWPRRRRPSPR